MVVLRSRLKPVARATSYQMNSRGSKTIKLWIKTSLIKLSLKESSQLVTWVIVGSSICSLVSGTWSWPSRARLSRPRTVGEVPRRKPSHSYWIKWLRRYKTQGKVSEGPPVGPLKSSLIQISSNSVYLLCCSKFHCLKHPQVALVNNSKCRRQEGSNDYFFIFSYPTMSD